MKTRTEHDTMGPVEVPAEALWGAQTQRSLEHFPIGQETMPRPVLWGFAQLKKACAMANQKLGILDEKRASLIITVCDELLRGEHQDAFPLSVWQTGSGTQTNMNFNEVIANRGNLLAGEKLLHPNDHVNMSQSSNDTFPSALHIGAAEELRNHLFPAMEKLIASFAALEEKSAGILKSGRTHLQDAVPLSFAQEVSGWRNSLENDLQALRLSSEGIYALALGGTAVGTGLNAPAGFAEGAARALAENTGYPFISAPNKFQALTSKSALVFSHGAVKAAAADYYKITTDIRWLSSGPRCGLGEISIPENEPGSSIMPGKVNPTQCESAAMVALQVMANDVAVSAAASQGNFELNVFQPLLAQNYFRSVGLLADSMDAFRRFCSDGITPIKERMEENLNRSLMLVTALNRAVGYENAASIAKKAYAENTTLKEAALSLGLLDAAELDRLLDPKKMV